MWLYSTAPVLDPGKKQKKVFNWDISSDHKMVNKMKKNSTICHNSDKPIEHTN